MDAVFFIRAGIIQTGHSDFSVPCKAAEPDQENKKAFRKKEHLCKAGSVYILARRSAANHPAIKVTIPMTSCRMEKPAQLVLIIMAIGLAAIRPIMPQ